MSGTVLLGYVQAFLLAIIGSTSLVVAFRVLPRSYARAHHAMIALLLITTGLQRILLVQENSAALWFGSAVVMPFLVVVAASSLISGFFPRPSRDGIEPARTPWMSQATFILLIAIIVGILLLFAWSLWPIPFQSYRATETPTATFTATVIPTATNTPTPIFTETAQPTQEDRPPRGATALPTVTVTLTPVPKPTPTRVEREVEPPPPPPPKPVPTEKQPPTETPCFRGNSGKPCK